VDTLTVFLHALNVPVHRSVLHQAVRQFLHRMVVCLETDILPFIPVAMQSLLEHADVRELYDFIPFVNQVVQKFKVCTARTRKLAWCCSRRYIDYRHSVQNTDALSVVNWQMT